MKTSPPHDSYRSPDIIKRLETFIDFALREAIPSPDDEHVLGVNQVLVNEYHAGQGISVSNLLLDA